jgi:outer membrane protein OmpA-like peptidoglycan-associated protein/tetratricopeptide (TPR) repeat protein
MCRVLLILFSISAMTVFGQRSGSGLLENRGDEAFLDLRYVEAVRLYQEALARDTANTLLKLKIADSYRMASQPERAKDWYDNAFKQDAAIPRVQKLNYAKVLIAMGLHEEAEKCLTAYQDEYGADPLVTAQLNGLVNAGLFEKNRSSFAVKAVDFNSSGMEFSPFPYQKGIVFVSSRPRKGSAQSEEESFLNLFYTEEGEDGSFSTPVALTQGNNAVYHEGPAVFFDGEDKKIISRNLFVKKGRMKDGSVNTLSLAQSSRGPSGAWSEPVAMAFASPEFSVAHPAISRDGTTLYFASNMPGTVGESDIFVSKLLNGAWSKPRNLGAKINTAGQELFPFLYNDSTLFFASTGHSGLGGLDLFYCNLGDKDLTVTNFGAPVNSKADDFGIFLESGGSSGFFSSNRGGGAGADDIYYFEAIQPFARIQLYDSLTRHPVKGAMLTLLSDATVYGQTRSDLTGAAEFRLSPLRDYALEISAGGYKSAKVTLTPGIWPTNQFAQIKVYLTPLYHASEEAARLAIQTRQRTNLTNIISFSSTALDVDMATETTGHTVDTASVAGGGDHGMPALNIIAVEVVNDLPAVMLVKNDTIYDLTLVSEFTLANANLGVEIDIPRGAKRHDYEKIIAEQVALQGYAIRKFLLIRSFFFDSGKSWVRNDACAQLDKIIDVMLSYPRIKVQMTFHSDSRGTDSFNLDLSKARSEEVKSYLVRAGIKPQSILSRFVGEGQLLNDCGDLADCDELLHQTNRTVEFKFILE